METSNLIKPKNTLLQNKKTKNILQQHDLVHYPLLWWKLYNSLLKNAFRLILIFHKRNYVERDMCIREKRLVGDCHFYVHR